MIRSIHGNKEKKRREWRHDRKEFIHIGLKKLSTGIPRSSCVGRRINVVIIVTRKAREKLSS